MELKGVLLSQPWGMYGQHGIAGQLYASAQDKTLDSKIPFGEYIIGGDTFFETFVINKDEYINSFFKQLTDKELGKTAFSEFGTTIPFSLAIISLRLPGPLLCYPSEGKASVLHAKNAKRFLTKGQRHQILVPLTTFVLLIGFRSLDFIIHVFEKVPEFRIMVDGTLIDKFLRTKDKNDFLVVFKALLDTLPSQIEYAAKLLKEQLSKSEPSSIGSFHHLKLFEKMVENDPSDVGIFLPYFLNIVKLERFKAITIPAEIPYVFLNGQAIHVYNNVENGAAAAFWTRTNLESFFYCLNLCFWTPEEIGHLAADIRSVDNNINEFLTETPCYRVYVGTIPKRSKSSIPRLYSFSLVMIIEGHGKINDILRVVPGAAFLFFRREKVTFTAVDKILFVQVSINLLA